MLQRLALGRTLLHDPRCSCWTSRTARSTRPAQSASIASWKSFAPNAHLSRGEPTSPTGSFDGSCARGCAGAGRDRSRRPCAHAGAHGSRARASGARLALAMLAVRDRGAGRFPLRAFPPLLARRGDGPAVGDVVFLATLLAVARAFNAERDEGLLDALLAWLRATQRHLAAKALAVRPPARRWRSWRCPLTYLFLPADAPAPRSARSCCADRRRHRPRGARSPGRRRRLRRARARRSWCRCSTCPPPCRC